MKKCFFVWIVPSCALLFTCTSSSITLIQEKPETTPVQISGAAATKKEITQTELQNETENAAESEEAVQEAEPVKNAPATNKKKGFINEKEAEWYISNGSGMLLEKANKTRALRSQYAVVSQKVGKSTLPNALREYYNEEWTIICRIFYEDIKRIRTQWVFQDTDTTMFNAVAGNDGSGFMEWYNEDGRIVEEERLAADGSGLIVAYTYKNNFLLQAGARHIGAAIKPEEKQEKPADNQSGTRGEVSPSLQPASRSSATPSPKGAAAPLKSPEAKSTAEMVSEPEGPANIPDFYATVTKREGERVWKDDYRYTREAALRTVIRTNYKNGAAGTPVWMRFPRFEAGSERDKEFVTPGNSSISSFINDVVKVQPDQIKYDLDKKQHVISETHLDEEGNIIGQLTNTWQQDRIKQIEWKSKDDTRVVEYTYNNKNERTGEKNYRNGVLERSVTITGNTETEMLYYDNKPILQALWENGVKTKEERLQYGF